MKLIELYYMISNFFGLLAVNVVDVTGTDSNCRVA